MYSITLIKCGGKYYAKSTKCMVRLMRGPTIDHAGPINGSAKKAKLEGHRAFVWGDMQEQPIFNLLIVHQILAKRETK